MADTENPTLAEKIKTFQALKAKKALCWLTLRWSTRCTYLPKMKFTWLLPTLVGAGLVWKPPSPPKVDETRARETGGEQMACTKCDCHGQDRARLVLLSLMLTTAAVLGWWSTEVLYREQVVYAYDSQSYDSPGATTSQK